MMTCKDLGRSVQVYEGVDSDCFVVGTGRKVRGGGGETEVVDAREVPDESVDVGEGGCGPEFGCSVGGWEGQ